MKHKLARRAMKNSFLEVSSLIVSKISSLLFSIVLARLLQPELFGTYYLALSVGFLFMEFANFGLSQTAIRWIAYAVGKGKNILARSYLKFLIKIKFALAVLVSLAMFFTSNMLSSIFNNNYLFLPFQIVSFYIFFQTFYHFLEGILVSVQNFKYKFINSVVFQALRFVLVPLFIIAGYSVIGALGGLLLSTILTFIIGMKLVKKRHGFLLSGKTIGINKRKILRFLLFFSIGVISYTFFVNIDSIMIGWLISVEGVGFYKVASGIVFSIASLITVSGVFFPIFTQLKKRKIEVAFQKVFGYIAIFSFPMAFGLVLIAKPFISVVYGTSYIEATLPLYILSFLVIEISLGSLFHVLLASRNMPQSITKSMLASTIINVVLNYFFILNFGIVGAAMATTISRYFNFVVLGALLKIKLNISIPVSSLIKPFTASLVMIFLLLNIPKPINILTGIFEIMFGIVIYFSVLFAIGGFTKKDWNYIRNVIGF